MHCTAVAGTHDMELLDRLVAWLRRRRGSPAGVRERAVGYLDRRRGSERRATPRDGTPGRRADDLPGSGTAGR